MYEVDYIDAFPINVGAISLGYAQNGEYAKVSVTFSYRKWKAKDIEFNPPSQQSLNPADRLGNS